MVLKQRITVIRYIVDFQKLQIRVDQEDEAFIEMFYQGLKDNIKDELAKNDRLEKLVKIIEKLVKIDNRFIER